MKLKLLIDCPDQKGLVYEVTKFVSENGGNIIDSQQHSLGLKSHFFMRLEIDASELKISADELDAKFADTAAKFQMNYKFSYQKKKMAILVSKYDHCLYDILQRHRYGELDVEIPIIISNHPDLEHVANSFGIEFKHLPIAKGEKTKQEKEIIDLCDSLDIDFIAMARYMQILTGDFVNHYPSRIINVHHGFLPSFKGANPYGQAYEKGVKMIGATAHYATEDLDMGPIISQDVTKVNYRDSVDDYKSKGRDIEELVFARAIRAHAEDKIICFDGRTIVFD